MADREPGFYWLHRRRTATTHGPNPTIAYWSGEEWQFIGSLSMVGNDEPDDWGVVFSECFDVLGLVGEPQAAA